MRNKLKACIAIALISFLISGCMFIARFDYQSDKKYYDTKDAIANVKPLFDMRINRIYTFSDYLFTIDAKSPFIDTKFIRGRFEIAKVDTIKRSVPLIYVAAVADLRDTLRIDFKLANGFQAYLVDGNGNIVVKGEYISNGILPWKGINGETLHSNVMYIKEYFPDNVPSTYYLFIVGDHPYFEQTISGLEEWWQPVIRVALLDGKLL